MPSPKIGKRQRVYRNKYHEIFQVSADFGEYTKEYFVSNYGRRVGLVIARDEKILLISQYRLLIDRDSWEIPGGRVDARESFKQATAREALEETALLCRNLKPLIYFHPGLDTFHNPTQIFYSDQFKEAPLSRLHKNETSGRAWMPLTQCIAMIFAGQIIDSLTVASLLAFHALKTNPKLKPRLMKLKSVPVLKTKASASRIVRVSSKS